MAARAWDDAGATQTNKTGHNRKEVLTENSAYDSLTVCQTSNKLRVSKYFVTRIITILTSADYILLKQASIIGGLLGVLSITMFCKGTDLIVCTYSVLW